MCALAMATERTPLPSARSPWLRRTLLIGAASAGLWLAGSLGHAASAHAAALAPVHPAHVAGSLAQARQLPLPIVRLVPAGGQKLLHDRAAAAGRNATRAAVPAAVPVPAMLPVVLPVPAHLPVPAPAVLPATSVLNLLAGPVDTSASCAPTPARAAIRTGLVLLVRAAVPASPSSAARPALLGRHPGRPGAQLPRDPIVPTGTGPDAANGGGAPTTMALLAPGGCPSGDLLGPGGRPNRRLPAPRERASAPAVSPD